MRKGFDGLSGLVEECFRQDLLDGHLFRFVNRRGDRIKVLYLIMTAWPSGTRGSRSAAFRCPTPAIVMASNWIRRNWP
jgi:transposase